MNRADRIGSAVDDLLARNEAERYQAVLQLYLDAASGGDPSIPVGVGIALRERGEFSWADYVLSIADKIPSQRQVALFERSVAAAMSGNAVAALRNLETLAEQTALSPYQLRHKAIQHARLGQLALARALTEQMANLDPQWQGEALATLQFTNYIGRFPHASALKEYEALAEMFKFASTAQIEAAIISAIQARQPFLLLRTGDGEGAFTRISLEDECEFAFLYRANRHEFTRFWFKDQAVLDDPGFELVFRGYDRSLALADYWAGFHVEGINLEYRIASRRGIAALMNLIRRAQLRAEQPGSVTLCNPTVHYSLLLSGAFDRILTGLAEISVISCHSQLPGRLSHRYAIPSVNFIRVPGEMGREKILGSSAAEGVHFPSRFNEICTILRNEVSPGQVFLVAAGLLGKVYCGIIKERGGIAIDIGAVADIWMGKNTRVFPDRALEMVLQPAPNEAAE